MKSPILVALAACLLAVSAHAQSPATAAPTAAEPVIATDAKAAPAPAPAPAPVAEQAPASGKPPLSEANCVRQTGSRIRQRDAKSACNGQPGRSYTKDELDSTGHTDLADALRALDPAVR